jgi:hypothetical protein
MKKLLFISLLMSFIFLFSCSTMRKIKMTIDNKSDSLSLRSDLLFYRSDTLKIEQDTIFVQTNKVVKKVNESFTKNEDKISIEFVGNTEIQKAISNNGAIPANAGLGVRFVKDFGTPTSLAHIDKLELDLSISIASTVDTIRAKLNSKNIITNVNDFGSSVLLPLNSGQSVTINGKTFMNNRNTKNWIFLQNWGLEGSLSASNRVWNLADTSQNVSSLSGTIGVFSEMMPMKNMDNFSISFGADFSIRKIFGNVGQHYSDYFRKQIIGTDKTTFIGFEPNISIRLRDIKATASFPLLFSKNDVSGLTRGQFVTMIRFTGGFPLSLVKNTP